MAYQEIDTQPQRTELAWARTSLALFVLSIWVCRSAFLGQSTFAMAILLVSLGALLGNFLILRTRGKKLALGVEQATASGLPNLLVVIQVLLISVAALLLEN
jgi:UPF0716 family protein affecting phage T7 exclusion